MSKERRFPDWMRRKVTCSQDLARTREMLKDLSLNTVCQSARCPNLSECFSRRTATFMILGPVCTRGCRFCAVDKGLPEPPDIHEPERVAEAAVRLGLKHVVVTSVTRDDLPDGGAQHFANTIEAIRKRLPCSTIEVLIPDFRGDREALYKVVQAKPDVINHNVETVPRLYSDVRPQADYKRSLELLKQSKKLNSGILTKSGLMVGLGETTAEVLQVMSDLRRVGCSILTIGQYLQPTADHLPVGEYITPQTYQYYRDKGFSMGFNAVEAGPYVRSSYRAGDVFKR
ncbi:lipoic acid synthetase [Desulfohalotomaculum tongense]|uniref:lipoyl synthase n=1 Tax=Desulforadius tongensis TaxID=1216062 RepID=UPI0019573D29|nr:lipoyl synthase [Desulforadius tongensis]MBM7855364.1 lipoic acid synthetase [Desulforadius tongensis]